MSGIILFPVHVEAREIIPIELIGTTATILIADRRRYHASAAPPVSFLYTSDRPGTEVRLVYQRDNQRSRNWRGRGSFPLEQSSLQWPGIGHHTAYEDGCNPSHRSGGRPRIKIA